MNTYANDEEQRKYELRRNVIAAINTILSSPTFAGQPRNRHPISLLTNANSSGFRPIHFAAASNNVPLLQTLLDIFSFLPTAQVHTLLESRDKEGNTATHWAVMKGNVDALALLIKAGAAISIANSEGCTPLHAAVAAHNSLPKETCYEIISLLLRHGANPNVGDALSVTPLHIASELGDVSIVELLVEEGGASVNVVDEEGETALFYALRGQCEEVVRALVGYGADLMGKNGDGESVFDFVNSVNDAPMAKLLESLQQGKQADSGTQQSVSNPWSLSMELSQSCNLSASSEVWFSANSVKS